MEFVAGGTDNHGKVIRDVLHANPHSCVYTTEDNHIGWKTVDGYLTDSALSIAESTILLNELRAVFRESAVIRDGVRLIATGLSTALRTRRADDTRDFFLSAREFIDARRRERLHLTYLGTAATTALSVSIISVASIQFSNETARHFLVATALGAIGGFLSVALRFRTVPVERYSSARYTAAAGMSRAILGALFGALFLLFQRAGILLAVASSNEYLRIRGAGRMQ